MAMEPIKRKMAMVVNQIRMDDEDALDVAFWLTKTPSERIEEVTELRKRYFTWKNGFYPSKMEKVVNKKPL